MKMKSEAAAESEEGGWRRSWRGGYREIGVEIISKYVAKKRK